MPGDKVEASYEGTLRLIPRTASIAAITLVFDNSGIAGTTHRNLMTMRSGRIVTLREPLPEWAEVAYRDALSAHRDEPP